MKPTILIILAFSFSAVKLSADDRDSSYVMGWPRDAFTMEPVIDSTLVEIMTPDSTVVGTGRPTWDTRYRPNSNFYVKVPARSGNFIIRVSNPGYKSVTKAFRLKIGKRSEIYTIGTMKMRRLPKNHKLGEAVVTATKVKFYTKGDTLIYKADAFNLAEGSMLDALISQLPGAELKRDGRIFVSGKLVESLLLNGKDFFKGDNTVLLDNLPAYTVQHVKVYDKQSEFMESVNKRAGRKVLEGSFVMDVVLKREYQIGWLANAEAGGGTHDRWLARLFALRFTPQSRITVFANANNTHENRKPGGNGDWWPSDIGNGTTTSKTGGVDYLVDDKQGAWRVEGNLSATHNNTDSETRQSMERFQNGTNAYTRRKQTGDYTNTSVATNHHFQFNLGPENDKHATELHIRPVFNYSKNENYYESLAAEFSANPEGKGYWESVFQGPEAGNALASILVNRVQTRQKGNSTSVNGGTAAEAQFFIQSLGIISRLNAGVNGGRVKDNSFDLYNMGNKTGNDKRHRFFDRPADNLNANAGLHFTIPFDAQWNWVATAGMDYNFSHDKKENSLYRLDWLKDMADGDLTSLPSTREHLLEALDHANSYLSDNDKHTANVYFDGRYDNNIYKDGNNYARFRFTWKAGITFLTEKWNYQGEKINYSRRKKFLPSAGLEILRNTPGMKHEFELQTAYKQQLPSMFSLMNLRFDGDPLNINEGNSGLKRTDVFTAIFFYNSRKWMQKQGRRLSADVRLNAYRNSVATAQSYDAETGVRTYRPENVNGNWDVEASGRFYTPIGKKGFSITPSFINHYYHSVDLVGGNAKVPTRSVVNTNYLGFPVDLNYSKGKLRVGISGSVGYNHASSAREGFVDINAIDMKAGINGQAVLPLDFRLATDFTYYARRGYSNNSMNTDDFVWNAQLSKSILRGNLTFALIGYDILGQLSNISYSVDAQGAVETWRNVIPSYGMLRVIYKLNKQPKKRR